MTDERGASLRFFLPMEHVPTATAQEKGYRVVERNSTAAEGDGRRVHGRKGKYKVITYEKEDTAEAKAVLLNALAGWLKKNEIHPDREHPILAKGVPVSLTVKWCFANYRMVSEGKTTDLMNDTGREDVLSVKKKITHPHGSYRVTKPDTDNLNKALKDCMTQLGFWADDAQVCEEHIGKYWSENPGIWVEITQLLEIR